jgi:hypothetical protein
LYCGDEICTALKAKQKSRRKLSTKPKKLSKKPLQKIVNKAIKSRKNFSSKKPLQKEGLGMCGHSTEHRAQSTEHRAQSTEHRAQSTEHRAQSTEHRA